MVPNCFPSALTTVPKIGALLAIYRLVLALPGTLNWPLVIAAPGAASMTLGNRAIVGGR